MWNVECGMWNVGEWTVEGGMWNVEKWRSGEVECGDVEMWRCGDVEMWNVVWRSGMWNVEYVCAECGMWNVEVDERTHSMWCNRLTSVTTIGGTID